MKNTMVVEKPAAAAGIAAAQVRTASAAVRGTPARRLQASNDRQIAEIEKTFSARWEW